MTNKPFYADADAISRTDRGKRKALVFAFYIGLIFIANISLAIGDKADSSFTKLAMVAWLLGVPVAIMLRMRKAVETHADELLKREYYGAAARSCGSVIILVLIWVLWGRWFDDIFGGQSGGNNTVGNLAITVAPYLTIWSIYTYVRRKMITLSGDGS